MSETSFTKRLVAHNNLHKVSGWDIPSYFPEAHLDLADHVFYHADAEFFVTVREYSSVSEVRLFFDDEDMTNGVTLYSQVYDDRNGLDDVCRFLTSKYLHNPTLNFACSLMGYNPETHMCYELKTPNIEKQRPEHKGPYAFNGCSLSSVWSRDFGFEPDLRAVLSPPDDSASQKYAYVFTEAVIEVDVLRQTNWVTPLVYEDAWRDFLDNSSGDLLRAEGDYSTEIVCEQI